ncbi:MAG: hypothetical protein AAGG75_00520 [Bacteroidota bacterium]
MFKYTKYTLKKIEELFSELKYTIRYERGNFQSGYCIVENRRIAVINKFFDTEARINCLLEILGTIRVEEHSLTEKTAAFYKKLSKLMDQDQEVTDTKESKEETIVESEVKNA